MAHTGRIGVVYVGYHAAWKFMGIPTLPNAIPERTRTAFLDIRTLIRSEATLASLILP